MGVIMKFIANLLWIIFGGIWLALAWAILGLLLCITIVGIPFGVQCFKAARLSLAPYGKKVRLNFGKHPIMNIIWFVLLGWELAIFHFVVAIFQFITIIGFSRGLLCLKMMKLSLFPFGAEIERR